MTRFLTVVLALVLVDCGIAVAQARTLDVGDATINYDVSGRGPTVVFIHGWAHNLSVWDDQVPAFKSRYQVVRYDTRGFGRSTGYADQSADPQDLLVLLEALHVRRAYIVGHSRGGSVALRFAHAYPDRVAGLVLEGAFPEGFPASPEFRQMLASFAAIAREHGLDSVGKVVLASPLAWVPAGRTDVTDRYRRLWAAYTGKDLTDPHPPSGRVAPVTMADLGNVRVPTLVITGDHEAPSIAAVADSLVRRIPGAKKVIIPNAGHGAHLAQPASFNSALMDFFYEVGRNKKQ